MADEVGPLAAAEESPSAAEPGVITEHDLDRVIEDGFRWLRFPPAIEAEFLQSRQERLHRVGLWLGFTLLVVFNAFAWCDYLVVRDIFHHALILRLGLVTPIYLALHLLKLKKVASRLRWDLEISAVTILCAGFTVYLVRVSHEPHRFLYLCALGILLINCNVLMRSRFPAALVATLAIVLMTCSGPGVSRIPVAVTLFSTFVLMIAGVSTLIANYIMDREERMNYLYRRKEQVRTDELIHENHDLLELSTLDPLTGVANRRYFDKYMGRTWRLLRASGTPVSLVVFDIDHFKLFNDLHGHFMGDAALKVVATTLRGALRRSSDLLARYGGEEFVTVLPGMTYDEAHEVGERLRQAVERINVERALPGCKCNLSVSAGIATVIPGNANSPAALVREADRWLYAAKAMGRNRSCGPPALNSVTIPVPPVYSSTADGFATLSIRN